MKPIARLLRAYLTLGAIVGPLPNLIVDGQAVDAVPVMADMNWIISQINANAYSQTDVNNLIAALGTPIHTYTPVLSFGGASVGITYVAQEGFWQQFGKVVFVMGRLGVTAVGSSTGTAAISLPLPMISTVTGVAMPMGMSVAFANFTGLANQVTSRLSANSSLLVPSTFNTAANAGLIDFSNINVQAGTAFNWAGWYPTN